MRIEKLTTKSWIKFYPRTLTDSNMQKKEKEFEQDLLSLEFQTWLRALRPLSRGFYAVLTRLIYGYLDLSRDDKFKVIADGVFVAGEHIKV